VTSDYDYNNLNTVCGPCGNITVTYTVTDQCNNSSTISATLNFGDATGPDLSACTVTDQTLECDGDNNQTGQMLAALLDYPQATNASEVALDENSVTVTREIDGGLQTLKLNKPAIITTDLRLNEPRYASLPNIMKAKKKELIIKNVNDLGIDVNPRTELLSVELPPSRDAGIIVESVDELVDKLKNEAKVIG